MGGERLAVGSSGPTGPFPRIKHAVHIRRIVLTAGGDHESFACENAVAVPDTRQIVHNSIEGRPGCFASAALEVDSTVKHNVCLTPWTSLLQKLRTSRDRSPGIAVFVIYGDPNILVIRCSKAFVLAEQITYWPQPHADVEP